MASEQDVWELVVKTVGQENLTALKDTLKAVESEVYELADTYEVLGEETKQVTADTTELEATLARTAAGARTAYAMFAEAATTAAKSQDKLTEAKTRGKKSAADLGGSILELSRGLEDLQYGVAGLINNIPQLALKLGLGGGIAGVISLAVVGTKVLYDHWDDLMNLFVTKQPFPKAAEDIAGMKRELDAAKESMEKLEKQGMGTTAELEEYNKLRARTAEIETTIANQTERQAQLKKVMEAPTAETEGRAKGFAEAVKGRGPQTMEDLTQGYINQATAELEEAFKSRGLAIQKVKAANLTREEELKAIESINAVYRQQKADIEARDPAKLAEDLMLSLSKGEEAAFVSLDSLVRHSGNLFGDLQARIDAANPILKKQADEWAKALEAGHKIEIEAAKEQAKLAEDFIKTLEEVAETEQRAKDVEAKRADIEKTRAATVRMQLDREANKPFLERETRTIKEGGLAEQAEAMLAQAQAAGGAEIKGRFRRLTPDQQFEFVQARAQQQLAQQFPKMPAGQRADMATRITAMGKKGLEQRMVDLQAQGVQANDLTLAAMQTALVAVQQLGNRLARQGIQAGRLQRGFQNVGNQMQERQPAAGNVGH